MRCITAIGRKVVGLSLLGMTMSAFAQSPRETVTFSNVLSNGDYNTPNNSVRTFSASGGYNFGGLRMSGNLSRMETDSFLYESQLEVTTPRGNTIFVNPFDSDSSGVGPFMMTPQTLGIFGETGQNPSGTWGFRFFESYDDGGANADAIWNSVTFDFLDYTAPPVPTATNLGSLTAENSPLSSDVTIPVNSISWFRFTLDSDITASALSFLDIDTEGSARTDTALGLYSETGILLASDDDDGSGFQSQLTFGIGDRPAAGSGLSAGMSYNGRDGSLTAGTYYLALGGYEATFADGFGAASTDTNATRDFRINLRTNITPVPAPSAWAVFVVGALPCLLFSRRRVHSA